MADNEKRDAGKWHTEWQGMCMSGVPARMTLKKLRWYCHNEIQLIAVRWAVDFARRQPDPLAVLAALPEWILPVLRDYVEGFDVNADWTGMPDDKLPHVHGGRLDEDYRRVVLLYRDRLAHLPREPE